MKPSRLLTASAAFAAFVLVTSSPTLSGAASRSVRQRPKSVSYGPKLGTVVTKTFSSTIAGGTVVKITADGNVVGFASPKTLDHIAAGDIVEGYVLCYTNPKTAMAVNAYDVAFAASGFKASTHVASPYSVTRTTTDGVLRLKQAFVFNGLERSLQITMTLTNLSGQTVKNIRLRRQVDFDADAGGSSGTGSFTNLFGATTSGSVFAYNDSGGSLSLAPGDHGMLLRFLNGKAGTKLYGPTSGSATSSIYDSACSPGIDPTPDGPLDLGATQNFLVPVTLTAGQVLTETIEYESI